MTETRWEREARERVMARYGECLCGHPLRDHSPKPALDGRAGCLAARGLARCECRREGGIR